MVSGGSSRRMTISCAASNLKSRQLSYLNAQLAQLQANVMNLDNHIQVTIQQAEYIRKLGTLHGGLYVLPVLCMVWL
jgi:hypothetical protein